MHPELQFEIKTERFDEHYVPSAHTRLTTNFANLARGASRKQNLRNTLRMMDNRCNALAHWDNPNGERYAIALDIVSVDLRIDSPGGAETFPLIEMLHTHLLDRQTHQRIEGIVGNSFSSYVRDYDFSVLLPRYNAERTAFGLPDGFGQLHGQLFQQLLQSHVYQSRFRKPPVICISASTSKTYERTGHQHPVLGMEYRQHEPSSTDQYFAKMGLQVRFFMPPGSVAPLAFYFQGDLLNDYTPLELIGTISTMEAFQKIYRPEIYNANAEAGRLFRPSLQHQDYSLTQIVYDREERRQLAAKQGKFAEQHLIQPHKRLLDQWTTRGTH